MAANGLLVVISAPSGGGKSTVIRRLLERGDSRFSYSTSMTTRPRRENEVDGKDYIFVSEDEFSRRIENGDFVEWAIVHDHYYGTPKESIERMLAEGRTVLLDIDVQGGLELKRHYKDRAFLIFIMPPNLQALEQRLRNRNTESEEEVSRRLAAVPREIEYAAQYDKIVVNENLEETVSRVMELIDKKHQSLEEKDSYGSND